MSGKAPFHCKGLVDFDDNNGLINFLGWFSAIQTYFCFSKFECNISSVYNILNLWRFYLCSRNFFILLFSEFPFRGIPCLIETSQLILACELAFALPDFWLAEFSDQIKNDLFAVFHHGLEISKVFCGNTYIEAHFL